MIRNFTEHSANERTFLAWVRTGIAVIGFGFVIEKFNFFILAAASAAPAEFARAIRTDRLTGPIGRYEGLALMVLGIVLIMMGYWRFSKTANAIDVAETRRSGVQAEVVVTAILLFLVAAYCVSILTG